VVFSPQYIKTFLLCWHLQNCPFLIFIYFCRSVNRKLLFLCYPAFLFFCYLLFLFFSKFQDSLSAFPHLFSLLFSAIYDKLNLSFVSGQNTRLDNYHIEEGAFL